MPHARDTLFRLHFEADAESDALLRVLGFARTLSLIPEAITATRDGDLLAAAIAFDCAEPRPAELLLGKTQAMVTVHRAWIAECRRGACVASGTA